MRKSTWAIAALAGLVLTTGGSVLASHTFTDVSDGNVFHADIDWLADTGVTRGCNPPDNDMFCPKENVTREQMAAFLHRFADNLSPGIAAINLPDKDITTSSLTKVGAVTINAPQAGHIVVTATGYSEGMTLDDTILSFALNVSADGEGDDLKGSDGILVHGASGFFPPLDSGANFDFRYPFAVTRHFEVDAPGSYTFHLFAKAVVSDDDDDGVELDVTVSVPVLTATYYYKAYGSVPS